MRSGGGRGRGRRDHSEREQDQPDRPHRVRRGDARGPGLLQHGEPELLALVATTPPSAHEQPDRHPEQRQHEQPGPRDREERRRGRARHERDLGLRSRCRRHGDVDDARERSERGDARERRLHPERLPRQDLLRRRPGHLAQLDAEGPGDADTRDADDRDVADVADLVAHAGRAARERDPAPVERAAHRPDGECRGERAGDAGVEPDGHARVEHDARLGGGGLGERHDDAARVVAGRRTGRHRDGERDAGARQRSDRDRPGIDLDPRADVLRGGRRRLQVEPARLGVERVGAVDDEGLLGGRGVRDGDVVRHGRTGIHGQVQARAPVRGAGCIGRADRPGCRGVVCHGSRGGHEADRCGCDQGCRKESDHGVSR